MERGGQTDTDTETDIQSGGRTADITACLETIDRRDGSARTARDLGTALLVCGLPSAPPFILV